MSLAHLIGSIRTWTLWTSTLMSSISHCDERQESDQHQTVVFLLFSWGTCGYTEWMYELCHSYPLDSLFFVIHIFFIFSKRNAHRNKTNKTNAHTKNITQLHSTIRPQHCPLTQYKMHWIITQENSSHIAKLTLSCLVRSRLIHTLVPDLDHKPPPPWAGNICNINIWASFSP